MSEEHVVPTPEEVNSILSDSSDDLATAGLTAEEADVAKKLLGPLTKKISDQYEAQYAERLKAVTESLTVQNREMIEKELANIREANAPPTPDQLNKLLSQEYLEFTIPITVNGNKKDFIIRELPQKAEKKILAAFQKKLVPQLQKLQSVEWTTGTMPEKIQSLLNYAPEMFDLLAELVAICLDPREENPEMNGVWVADNLSSSRITNIITAQFEAGRMRDFFLGLSRLIPQMTTI